MQAPAIPQGYSNSPGRPLLRMEIEGGSNSGLVRALLLVCSNRHLCSRNKVFLHFIFLFLFFYASIQFLTLILSFYLLFFCKLLGVYFPARRTVTGSQKGLCMAWILRSGVLSTSFFMFASFDIQESNLYFSFA